MNTSIRQCNHMLANTAERLQRGLMSINRIGATLAVTAILSGLTGALASAAPTYLSPQDTAAIETVALPAQGGAGSPSSPSASSAAASGMTAASSVPHFHVSRPPGRCEGHEDGKRSTDGYWVYQCEPAPEGGFWWNVVGHAPDVT
jgi:hypothetical protein